MVNDASARYYKNAKATKKGLRKVSKPFCQRKREKVAI